MDCITAPLTASPEPATTAARTCGSRICQTIISKRFDVPGTDQGTDHVRKGNAGRSRGNAVEDAQAQNQQSGRDQGDLATGI